MSSGKRKSEESAEGGSSKKLNMSTDIIPVLVPTSPQTQVHISPSIAKNPNKYLGAGSHKRNLQEAIEGSSQGLPVPRTPTKRPKKRLSKFSPFKKSPNKSPRKEMFPKQLEDQESDVFISTYERTFEKVLLVASVQMTEWQENNLIEDPLVDLNTLEKFATLSQSSKNLYVRLVNRKHAWLKESGLEEKYGKFGNNVLADLKAMGDVEVIDSNYEKEDLSTLLYLLQVPELKDFCKELKLSSNVGKKSDLVDSILGFGKNQRSLFGGDSSNNIKRLIRKYLGACVRLSPGPRDTFLSCVILVTFPFYHELSDHVTRLNDYISRIVRTSRGEIKFPSYKLHRTCVFKSRNSFQQYIEAYELCTEIDTAAKDKSIDAVPLMKQALQNLKEALRDKETMAEISDRPIYMRRYSAGYLFVKTIFSKLNILKQEFPTMAEQALLTLVGQSVFKEQDKGLWFESLAQLYMTKFKDNNKAATTILDSFTTLEKQRLDKLLSEKKKVDLENPGKKLQDQGWIKHLLIERASALISRQKLKIDKDKAEALRKWIADIDEPLAAVDVVPLSGKMVPNKTVKTKQIFMMESHNRDGDLTRTYMSVEDMAKVHFKRQGYIESRHDEGSTLKSIIYALFWDVIYSEPEHSDVWGVFQSPYQEAPLDWRTPNFYERRKGKIKKRLDEISEMTHSQLIAQVMLIVKEHQNESCVIHNWACLSPDNVNILTNFMTCIGVPLFRRIAEHIIKDVDHNAKGFPDLTMWNPNQKKAIFVEVKSQNDRLSIQQKYWLHLLKCWGADCCVAHLKPTGGSAAIVEENTEDV